MTARTWFAPIVSAVGVSVLGLVGQYELSTYQTQQSQRIAAVTKFIEVSQQFDRSVAEFVTPFVQGHDSKSQRDVLRKNIQDQFLALEQAGGILPASEGRRANAYKGALVEVDEQLGRNDPAPKAQKLVQAIANAREANVCVAYFMKAEVGLSVPSDDEEYCRDGRKPRLKPL